MSAAIYTRQSIEKKDSESIDVQIEYAKKYLDPDEPYEIFSDPGYSGKNTLRPDFQRMLKGIESGKFDKVIADNSGKEIDDLSTLAVDEQRTFTNRMRQGYPPSIAGPTAGTPPASAPGSRSAGNG